ncbi:ornithine cyclodeaminase family protein [Thalassotalea atypica]|uniref:ornithine cyclodeaminase family protein n=1 Tax=Thalassotalea atypica TaxID=2054316 RepID=UPI0025730516|nr:ornithine cyclodeaminase family protein [Thalassotalea atypica]
MKIISAAQVQQHLSFKHLIPLLEQAFTQPFTMPQRQVFHLDESHSRDAFALLPSWNNEVIGTKAFTYFPDNNADEGLHSLYSKIMLFKRTTGEPLALVDGTSVTYWRTAAISALASKLLSNQGSEHLVLFGTGNLAPYLIKAHLSVRPLNKITVVARSEEKAISLIQSMQNDYPDVFFSTCDNIEQSVKTADIICCATASGEPLFDGNHLKPGAHVDCLGNHNNDKRECDTTTVTRARVYVDSLVNNLAEAGELLLPMAEGAFQQEDIIAELAELCRNPAKGRQDKDEITLFKSVGTAISDLVTANYVFQQLS